MTGLINSILTAEGLGDSWKQKVQAILTVPHFKEKKRQGRKMFLRQSGEKELLLSPCIHWGFQRSLLSSLLLQPLIDHLWFRQHRLYWAPHRPQQNLIIYVLSFWGHFLSLFPLLPILPFMSRWIKVRSQFHLHGQLLSQERVNPVPPEHHKHRWNLSLLVCPNSDLHYCILEPRLMRTVACKATLLLICYSYQQDSNHKMENIKMAITLLLLTLVLRPFHSQPSCSFRASLNLSGKKQYL